MSAQVLDDTEEALKAEQSARNTSFSVQASHDLHTPLLEPLISERPQFRVMSLKFFLIFALSLISSPVTLPYLTYRFQAKPTFILNIHSNQCWLATIYSASQVLIHIVGIISEQVNNGTSIESTAPLRSQMEPHPSQGAVWLGPLP